MDICKNYHGGNRESVEAHENIKNKKQRQQLEVLQYIKNQGGRGATCYEVETALEMPHQSCSARCAELKRNGKVVTHEDIRRQTNTGRYASVLFYKGEL